MSSSQLQQQKQLKIKNSVSFAPSASNRPKSSGALTLSAGKVKQAAGAAGTSQSILKKNAINENNNYAMGGFSTHDSSLKPPSFMDGRCHDRSSSKSPMIDQTIMSTLPTQFNTLNNNNQSIQLQSSLAEEYKQRQRQMDERLKREIESHQVASVYPSNNTNGSSGPLQPLPTQSNSEPLPFEAKPQKFIRSQRSIAMRIKEDYDTQVTEKDQEKLDLIQRLNEAIIQLDRLNQEKGELNEKLIKLFQFTRDVERHTLRSDDLLTVVDESLKEEMRSEKQQSIVLKEQLKYLEEEKYRLRDCLSESDSRKEDFGQQKWHLQTIMEHKERDFASLEVEYLETKQRIEAFQREVDELSGICCQLQGMVDGHRHDLHFTNGGRVSLVDQFDQLERKYGFTQDQKTRELNELQFRHKRRAKLMACLIMTSRITDIANKRTYSNTLCDLRRYAKIKNACLQGWQRLRRILKQNRRSRLRRALYKWYFQELRPLRNYQQAKQVNTVLMKRHSSFRAFYAWRTALHKKVELIHAKLARLQKMILVKTHNNNVAMKEFFVRWRHTLNLRYNEWRKIEALRRLVNGRDTQIMRNRLFKWKALVIDAEFQIQTQAMLRRFTLKTFFTTLFQAWRNNTIDHKSRRLALMSKCWKSIRVYVMTQKQLRRQSVLLLREMKVRWRKNVVKGCLDGFRHNMIQEKYQRVLRMLNQEEIPRKEQCIEKMSQIQIDRNRQIKIFALKNLSNFKGKIFYQYLNHWKQMAEHGRLILTKDLKAKLIYRYKSVLQQGYNRWIMHRSYQILQQQSRINDSWQGQNHLLQIEIKSEEAVIEEMKDRQRVEAAKWMKRLVMESMERHLRVKYVQWRDNVKILSSREQLLEKIITSLVTRRMKRLAFNTYLDKLEITRQDLKDDLRGDKSRHLLSDRLKKRCFVQLQKNSKCSLYCKEIVRRTLVKLDIRHKDEAFKLWFRYLNEQRERALENSQNATVSQIGQHQSTIGTLSDLVEVQNQHNIGLQARYKHTCQRILALSTKRCHHMAQQYFFERWKNKLFEYQRSQRILMNAAQHGTKACIRYMFHKWIQNGSVNVKQKALISNLQYEMRVTQQVKGEIEEGSRVFEIQSDHLSSKINREKSEASLLEMKHSKCLSLMITRNKQNFYSLRLRYILNHWHQYVQNRKKYVQTLDLAIKKTLWQATFNEIRRHARNVELFNKKSELLHKFFNHFKILRTRSYLTQWLTQAQLKVSQISSKAHSDAQSMIKEQGKLIKCVNKRVQSQLTDNRHYVLQSECFQSWREEIVRLKAFRVKTQMQEQWQIERDKADAVRLWRQRVQQTKKFRRAQRVMSQRYTINLLQNTINAWQHYNRINKGMARALSNLANKVDKVYLLRSFESMKEHSDTSNTVTLFSKFKACQYLFSTLQGAYETSSIRTTFYLIRHGGLRMSRNERAIKSISKYWIAQKLRSYLKQWREETDRLEVVRFNLQEGVTSVKVHQLRQKLNALKQMCLLEGISPQKIQKIIVKCDAKVNEGVMRVVSRLLCNGDETLRIIPQCFDRWRQWIKVRKALGYWLNFGNSFANPKLQAMGAAFRKWKTLKIDLKSQLTCKKNQALQRICLQNDNKLYALASNFEGASVEIEDLTSQRSILLSRYVSSQKLALSSLNHQNERAQQKAISRWLTQCKRTEKVKLDQVLKQNLMRIAALKDRIKQVENSNQDIAIQNEDFRQGALDGIEMARNLDDLQREKEVLAIDLADKALVIRRLLEDNSNLNNQLAYAQEAAHRLIQQTQARFALQQQQNLQQQQ